MKELIKKEKTFLVTGGAGFIGSNICEELLKRGYKVRCLDNFSNGRKENIAHLMEDENFELLIGDIREYSICDKSSIGVDYIIHQAALGSVPRSVKEPRIYEEVNIKGTLNIFDAARNNNVKRVVFASSSSVYGDSTVLPKREGEEGRVLSPYALTKKVTEDYASLYTRLYGLETVALRYFNIYGRRQKSNGFYVAVIPKFISTILNDGHPKIDGDGMQSRDFTYIDDVIEANIKACFAPKEAAGEAFNIAAGGRESIIDVCNKITTILNKEIRYYHSESRVGDIRDSNADVSKAKNILGYEPKYKFDEGLKLTIDWYKNELKN
ncbi:NAD-dependent epimerase/dehydratase family protein [Clostridium sp.]|uniref:NAD-dependent epimerase/dehydratase family protein n=1 Tax=Clostridium sp. TaxID=1506 RepID=UPI003F3666B7